MVQSLTSICNIVMYIYNVIGAVIDTDDDYCACYTILMVDVNRLARPPRSPKHTGAYSCAKILQTSLMLATVLKSF